MKAAERRAAVAIRTLEHASEYIRCDQNSMLCWVCSQKNSCDRMSGKIFRQVNETIDMLKVGREGKDEGQS